MEPVGLGIGIAGLAGLFSSCLEAVERVQSYKDFKDDSEALDAQFNAEKLRFQKWGLAVGLQQEKGPAGHHHALDDPDTLSAVQDHLGIIQKIYDANGISTRRPFLAGTGLAKDGLFSASYARPSHGAPSASKMRKLAWALRGKAERTDQVKLFRGLVQQLHDLVPPDEAKGTRPIHGATAAGNDAPVPLQGDSSGKGAWPAELRQILDRLEGKMIAETQRELHAWLLGRSSPNELYDDAVQKRLGGTCDWILEHPTFLHWLSPAFPAKTAKLLWINGPAGFGKTILCARVIEYLPSTLPKPVAHFFFSSDFESRGDPYVAIRSWISQVVSRDAGAFDLVRERWEAEQEPVATRASAVNLFREVLRAVPGCTLVVDGLDECTSVGGESVARFLETVQQAVADTTTRVMIVSRDEPEIRNALTDTTRVEFVEYKVSPEDVRADTASYSRSIVDRKLSNKNEATRSDISRRMAERCEGQFLWLKMQEDCLRGGKNKKQLEDAIARTPAGLERLYDRNWERITGLQKNDGARAVSLLRWAASALRPLTVCEITEAVLIDEHCDDLLVNELPDSVDQAYIDSEILGLCGPLLEVRRNPTEPSPELGTVHLAHFSVKQYLLCNITARGDLLANESLRASHEAIESTVLAKLCLRYINFRRVWQGTPQEKGGHLGTWFRDYAAGSWYHHAIAGVADDAAMNYLVNALFDMSNSNWDFWRRHFDANDEGLEKDKAANEASPPSPLYYASKLGLTVTAKYLITERKYDANERSTGGRTALGTSCAKGHLGTVRALLEAGVDIRVADNDGRTALSFAAENGHEKVVNLLLAMDGIDVNSKSSGNAWWKVAGVREEISSDEALMGIAINNGWTPLYAASLNGHIEVANLLLKMGADMSIANDDGWTPLFAASFNGHVDVVKLLLKIGADIAIANNHGWTPLHAALHKGHFDVVELLVKEGANVVIADNNGLTPLYRASETGQFNIVKLLLEKGADVAIANNDGLTPLHRASFDGHVDVVKLLLEKGADVAITFGNGFTTLNAASFNGHVEVANLLLNMGADIATADNDGYTPLHAASINGHINAVKLLLEKGANIAITNNAGYTPLHLASEKGHFDVVKLLVEEGADVAIACNGRTPLHAASEKGHFDVVRLLVEEEADISIASNNGWTPLHAASFNGHVDVVKLLLKEGADVAIVNNNDGCTPLHLASFNGHVDVVRLLLAKGADIAIGNIHGCTPLYAASDKGQFDVVKLLLEEGADVAIANNSDGGTPLHLASFNGHVNVVKLLLENGADITVANTNGWTPINAASSNGHIEVVKLLLENPDIEADRTDDLGRTALFLASRQGHDKVVHVLLADGRIAPDAKDWYGSTSLFVAVRNGHPETVDLLLAAEDVCIDSKDGYGRSLMWWARRTGNTRVIKLLLQHAERAGTPIGDDDSLIESISVPFNQNSAWCDACTLCIPTGCAFYSCELCDGGNFHLCLECFKSDVKCRDDFHALVLRQPDDTARNG